MREEAAFVLIGVSILGLIVGAHHLASGFLYERGCRRGNGTSTNNETVTIDPALPTDGSGVINPRNRVAPKHDAKYGIEIADLQKKHQIKFSSL